MVYDCASRVATPLHVRAGKPACTAAWVDGNGGAGRSLVAVGFRDQHVAWLDPGSGALLRLVSLRGVPADLQVWVPPDGGPALLAASVGGRSLLVWQLPLAALPGEPLAGVGAGAGVRACTPAEPRRAENKAVPGSKQQGGGASPLPLRGHSPKPALHRRAAAAPGAPLELSFHERYGELQAHVWLEGGCLLAGFSSGQVAVVGVRAEHGRAPGTEVYSSRWALRCAARRVEGRPARQQRVAW